MANKEHLAQLEQGLEVLTLGKAPMPRSKGDDPNGLTTDRYPRSRLTAAPLSSGLGSSGHSVMTPRWLRSLANYG